MGNDHALWILWGHRVLWLLYNALYVIIALSVLTEGVSGVRKMESSDKNAIKGDLWAHEMDNKYDMRRAPWSFEYDNCLCPLRVVIMRFVKSPWTCKSMNLIHCGKHLVFYLSDEICISLIQHTNTICE